MTTITACAILIFLPINYLYNLRQSTPLSMENSTQTRDQLLIQPIVCQRFLSMSRHLYV